MSLIEELKEKLKMEIRPNSRGLEYLEAVCEKADLENLNSILRNYLGPEAKLPGKKARYPKTIQKLVDSIGGLRIEQTFFYKSDSGKVWYAALWPWQSDPEKITLKLGVWVEPLEEKRSLWKTITLLKR